MSYQPLTIATGARTPATRRLWFAGAQNGSSCEAWLTKSRQNGTCLPTMRSSSVSSGSSSMWRATRRAVVPKSCASPAKRRSCPETIAVQPIASSSENEPPAYQCAARLDIVMCGQSAVTGGLASAAIAHCT